MTLLLKVMHAIKIKTVGWKVVPDRCRVSNQELSKKTKEQARCFRSTSFIVEPTHNWYSD